MAGDVFFFLDLRDSAEHVVEALLRLPDGIWISSISLWATYAGWLGWCDEWDLKLVRPGDAEAAKAELDRMADRRKISQELAKVSEQQPKRRSVLRPLQ